MLPLLAQGAIMAIEDGYVLARALATYDVPAGLERYEAARMRSHAAHGRRLGREHPSLPQPARSPTRRKRRKFIDREWASQRIADRYEWLFRYDATKVVI